jgi:hypothetical protein
LALLDSMLAPESGAFAGLIDAVSSLGDDAFEVVFGDKVEHVSQGPVVDD